MYKNTYWLEEKGKVACGRAFREKVTYWPLEGESMLEVITDATKMVEEEFLDCVVSKIRHQVQCVYPQKRGGPVIEFMETKPERKIRLER